MKIQTVHVLRYPYSRVGSEAGDRRGDIPPGLFTSAGAVLSPAGSWTQCVHSQKARGEGTAVEGLLFLGHGFRVFGGHRTGAKPTVTYQTASPHPEEPSGEAYVARPPAQGLRCSFGGKADG